jgi:uncharacterized membrane protein YkvA (DUF1232 family)
MGAERLFVVDVLGWADDALIAAVTAQRLLSKHLEPKCSPMAVIATAGSAQAVVLRSVCRASALIALAAD